MAQLTDDYCAARAVLNRNAGIAFKANNGREGGTNGLPMTRMAWDAQLVPSDAFRRIY
jgi:hypothetical protein